MAFSLTDCGRVLLTKSLFLLCCGAMFPELTTMMLSPHSRSEVPFEQEDVYVILDHEQLDDLTKWSLAPLLANRQIQIISNLSAPHCVRNPNQTGRDVIIDLSLNSRIISDFAQKHYSHDLGTCCWVFAYSDSNLNGLRDIRPPFNSRVFTLRKLGDSSEIELREIFTISITVEVVEQVVEVWRNTEKIFQAEYIWLRRRDLQGITLTAAIFNYPPYCFLEAGKPIETATGFNMDLLHYLEKYLNFSTRLTTPQDGSFGRADDEGNWNGVVGMCQRAEIDFSANIISATLQRSAVVKYSVVVTSHRNVFVTRQSQASRLNSLLSLLHSSVWISLGLLIAMALAWAALVGYARQPTVDVLAIVMTFFGFFTIQGASQEFVKAPSMRIVTYTCLLFGLLTVNIFSARLTSHLSVKNYDNPIQSIDDIERLGLNVFMLAGTSTLDNFIQAPLGTVERRLYDNRISTSDFYTPETTDVMIPNFLSVENGAMLINPQQVLYWIDDNREIGCTFNTLPRTLKIRFAIPAQKSFPYLEAFDYVIIHMKQSGIMANLKRKWTNPMEKSMEYMCTSMDQLSGVDFSSIDILYMMLAGGSIIGLILSFVEKLIAASTRMIGANKTTMMSVWRPVI